MAAAAAATPAWCVPRRRRRRRPDPESTAVSVAFPFPLVGTATLLQTRRSASSPARASDPHRQPEEEGSFTAEDDNTTTTTNISQEDLGYMWRLGAGSVALAAVIKYGSVAFPEMTRPNIWEALVMVSAPVVVAVLLLINQSLREEQ